MVWAGRAVCSIVGGLVAGPLLLAGAAAGVAQAAGSASAGPLQRDGSFTSDNWAGYAVTSGPYTSVSASWVQPTATCGTVPTAASFWVGLDGDGSSTVEQTGTTADCVAGVAVYHAWWEMFPASEVDYRAIVDAGDVMKASVTASGTTFALTIADTTRGWTRTVHQSAPSAARASAEVIAEAPAIGTVLQPLTSFGTVTFRSAHVDGAPIGNVSTIITMAAGGVVKAQPSTLVAGQRFSVTWQHN